MLEAMEGDDQIYVQSTNPSVETCIFGGRGSDTIEVAGHAPWPQCRRPAGPLRRRRHQGVESSDGT